MPMVKGRRNAASTGRGLSPACRPVELTLTLTPEARYDAIDVAGRIRSMYGELLARYRRALYCSYHTTAGYLEQSFSHRLRNRREHLDLFVRAFQRLFPPGASYRHDQLELRRELSEEQRRREPRNADSHLAFIGSGLRNCATYLNHPGEPVYFMDLDGVNGDSVRDRTTSVLAYDDEEVVESISHVVPVSRHPIDSVNLGDPRLGLFELVEDLARRNGVEKGRIDISLDPTERDAGVTVNEFETLLMRHDLAEVLRDPLRFAVRTGRRALADPRAIPVKSLGYARYDMVHFLNELMDVLRISESAVERLLARVMAVPAARFLRLKRSVSFPISDSRIPGKGTIVHGTYQTPILIQWAPTSERQRLLHLTLHRFS
jgi:thiamine phosphate synthase YjbQ (UPF0047 family)